LDITDITSPFILQKTQL